MKRLVFLLILCSSGLFAQETPSTTLTLEEFLGWVKLYHPTAKQAGLRLSEGEAYFLKARGAFDPKMTYDSSRKDFNETEYYDTMKAAFKIPTWYGVEVMGSWENNEGYYLNPQSTVPDDGLYAVGIKVSVLDGLWINERMATRSKAKLFMEQTKQEQQLMLNELLYDASIAYFEWWRSEEELSLSQQFYENAFLRSKSIAQLALAGDRPAIDTVEASTIVQSRKLALEEAILKNTKSRLVLANYLWMDQGVPLELQDSVQPQAISVELISSLFKVEEVLLNESIVANHPKMKMLELKASQLAVDKRLKWNQLLPNLDLEYKLYSEGPFDNTDFNRSNYFGGIKFEMPLFLRKERGDLKLAKYKLEWAQWDVLAGRRIMENKLNAVVVERSNFQSQLEIATVMVNQYDALLKGEERKLEMGESNLFMVNSRESKLLESQLKKLDLTYKTFESQAKIFQSAGTQI